MAEKTGDTKFWSWIGKMAVLVGVILGLIQIIAYFSTPDYELEVTGDYAPIKYPLELQQSIASISKAIAEEPEKQQPIGNTNKKILLDKIKSFYLTESIWKIKIKNTGKKEISDLRFEAPFSGYHNLHNSEDVLKKIDFNQGLPLGSLRPSNEKELVIWAEKEIYDFGNNASGLRITHPNGVAEIIFPAKVTGLLARLLNSPGPLPFLIPFFLGLVLILVSFTLGVKLGPKI